MTANRTHKSVRSSRREGVTAPLEQRTRRPGGALGRSGAEHQLAGSDALYARGAGGVTRRALHDVLHAPDDGIVELQLGAGEGATVSFHPDPALGDAGADLADDLGRFFLEGALTGGQGEEFEAEDELSAWAEANELSEVVDTSFHEVGPITDRDQVEDGRRLEREVRRAGHLGSDQESEAREAGYLESDQAREEGNRRRGRLRPHPRARRPRAF